MDGEQFLDDFRFVGGELFGDRGEDRFQFSVLSLGGERLGPVEREVEVAAAVVDAGDFAGGRFVFDQELARRGVQGVGEDFGLGDAEGFAEVFERNSDGQKLAERIPAQVVLLGELLHVFRRGAAGTRFEESAAIHQRHDGKHLGAGAEFEDREQVR